MRQGFIVVYNPTKLWGFVRENDGSEWFFHKDNCVSGFQPSLGVNVAFDVAPPLRLGLRDQAVNVRGAL